MQKVPKIGGGVVAVIIFGIVLFALYLFALFVTWDVPFYPPSGRCHFGVVDSLGRQVNNPQEVFNVLSDTGWVLTSDFDRNKILEVDLSNMDYSLVSFIDDKSLRYWVVSAYKKFGDDTLRADLIDERGKLYVFYNCV